MYRIVRIFNFARHARPQKYFGWFDLGQTIKKLELVSQQFVTSLFASCDTAFIVLLLSHDHHHAFLAPFCGPFIRQPKYSLLPTVPDQYCTDLTVSDDLSTRLYIAVQEMYIPTR